MAKHTKAEENRIFRKACIGFGFEEVEQSVDGLFCDGCLRVHKRPTKMYKGGRGNTDVMCKSAIVRFYNPEEQ